MDHLKFYLRVSADEAEEFERKYDFLPPEAGKESALRFNSSFDKVCFNTRQDIIGLKACRCPTAAAEQRLKDYRNNAAALAAKHSVTAEKIVRGCSDGG